MNFLKFLKHEMKLFLYLIFLFILKVYGHWTTIIRNDTIIGTNTYTYNKTTKTIIYATIPTTTYINTYTPSPITTVYETNNGVCVPNMIGFACNKGVYGKKTSIISTTITFIPTITEFPTSKIESGIKNIIISTINISYEIIIKTKEYKIKLYYNKTKKRWLIPQKYEYLLD